MANSADPDQTAPIWVNSVCTGVLFKNFGKYACKQQMPGSVCVSGQADTGLYFFENYILL